MPTCAHPRLIGWPIRHLSITKSSDQRRLSTLNLFAILALIDFIHALAKPSIKKGTATLSAMSARASRVIAATERLTGRDIERAYVDKGYRSHDTNNPRRVFISGQKRGVFGVIKRELRRRRSAIEAVIGHMKTDGHIFHGTRQCGILRMNMEFRPIISKAQSGSLSSESIWVF